MRIVSTLSAAVLVAALTPFAADCQASTGTLTVSLAGQALETSTRVRVEIATTASGVVRADSGSRELRFAALPAGRYRVETRAIGFEPDTAFIEVRDGRDANVTVNLKRAVTDLAPVTVAGHTGHLAGFEKRRASGKGTFLTREDIEKSRRSQVSELLRSVRGMRVDCANGSCRAKMTRSTACEPRYFMNGFPSDATILHTPVLDVGGIEIYRGPSETPGEFMGAQSMCGAIVVWTK